MPFTRRSFCLSLAIGAGASAAGLATWSRYADRSELQTLSRTSHALGTKVEITALHASPEQASTAVDAAFVELEHVEEVLSLYRPTSQLCQLNREGVLYKPHPYLVTVLQAAQQMSEASEGKFDVTIQPLWELHAATRAGAEQDAGKLAATCERVDWRQLSIETGAIRLERPGMAVTLNGIAQGFAADRVAATLKNYGVEQGLVNTGEFAPLGCKADGRPWRIGIQHPRAADAFAAVIPLEGRCLATSGDYATRLNSASAAHHLLDPATGESAAEFTSVSIVAPSGMQADALSTAVFVLGVEKGIRLIEATPQADLLAILPSGRTIRTRGFPQLADDARG